MSQFITPVAGRLTQPFIPGSHYGVDIGAVDKSTVVASEAGRVTFEGIWGAGGNTIIITGSDGWKTYYCHLSKFIVSMGASVTQGQAIAQSGGALGEQGAGNATGPHLHFEIHNPQGTAVDPQQYISVGGSALKVLPTITTDKTIGGTSSGGILGDLFGAGKAIGFLTNASNWKRIGLFMAGSILLIIVLIELLKQTDAGKQAISSAKSAAKDAAVAAAA